jgi:transposase
VSAHSLLSILQKGCTYVADRGYFSFDVGNSIDKAKAFFIIRIKSNLKFTILQKLEITSLKGRIPECFSQISDQLIRFDNDPFKQEYRLIGFNVLQSHFLICSNRLDLTTIQIIMLYAYRWQVELMFKFLKRTLNGIHLFNNSRNGVMIHFYLFMIVALLKLRLKQVCQRKMKQAIQQKKQLEELNDYYGIQPEEWIKTITEDFYSHWKIGIHWIKTLKNLIDQPFSQNVVVKLVKQ